MRPNPILYPLPSRAAAATAATLKDTIHPSEVVAHYDQHHHHHHYQWTTLRPRFIKHGSGEEDNRRMCGTGGANGRGHGKRGGGGVGAALRQAKVTLLYIVKDTDCERERMVVVLENIKLILFAWDGRHPPWLLLTAMQLYCEGGWQKREQGTIYFFIVIEDDKF